MEESNLQAHGRSESIPCGVVHGLDRTGVGISSIAPVVVAVDAVKSNLTSNSSA
jgi:hypothetical protein